MRAGHCSRGGIGKGAHTEASFRRLGLRDMLEHWTPPMRACNAHAARKLVRNAEHAGWDGIDRMGAKRLAAEAGDWGAPHRSTCLCFQGRLPSSSKANSTGCAYWTDPAHPRRGSTTAASLLRTPRMPSRHRRCRQARAWGAGRGQLQFGMGWGAIGRTEHARRHPAPVVERGEAKAEPDGNEGR